MKILCLSSSLDSGGAERVLVSLCNAWSRRGDAVTLVATFSGGGKPFYEIADAVEVLYLAELVGIRKKNALSYVRRLSALRHLIKERSPDVVVSFLPNVNVAAIVATLFLNVPVIICDRDDPSSRSPMEFWEICSRLTYRFADMFTVQTEAVANRIPGIYPGLNKVRIVPNPLSEGLSSFSAKAGNDRKVLLSMGRLASQKQVEKMIDAFAAVAPQFDNWDLHIYGDGPLKESLHSAIAASGLQERVFLKGRTKEPWQIMAGADAFVMTSRHEGFPNALLEAMAVGLPCVVFDCPSGPREISRDGQDALLVPLDDHDGLASALTRIMHDEELRLALGRQARESVMARFSLRDVIDRWDHLFREVGAIQ